MQSTEPISVIESDGGINGFDPGLSEEELRSLNEEIAQLRVEQPVFCFCLSSS